ncbi:unnamed protein product [Angiostrongylus costaricensis]|uniref:PHB domain-containing protein n=1 Tax=Angiostrongylus costaricensis TaxID=334426 RepID=A0A0R3Q0X2_ANGCS|nr:unnamed protein product [Angiostrongylus costaricensis]
MLLVPLLFVVVLLVRIVAPLRSTLSPSRFDVFLNRVTNYTLTTVVPIQNDIVIHFKKQPYVTVLAPLTLYAASREGQLQLVGERPINELVLTVASCVGGTPNNTDCNAV